MDAPDFINDDIQPWDFDFENSVQEVAPQFKLLPGEVFTLDLELTEQRIN